MVATWVGHATRAGADAGPQHPDRPGLERTPPGRSASARSAWPRPASRFDDLPQDRRRAAQPQSLRPYGPGDAEAAVGPRPAADRHQPGNDAILRGAGLEARALDWGGQRRGARRASTVDRHAQPPLGQPLVHRPQPRACGRASSCALPGGNLFFAGDTGLGDGELGGRGGGARADPAGADPDRRVPLRARADGHRQPHRARSTRSRCSAGSARRRAMPIHWGTFRLSYEGYDTPPKLLAAGDALRRVERDSGVPVGMPQTIETQPRPRAGRAGR